MQLNIFSLLIPTPVLEQAIQSSKSQKKKVAHLFSNYAKNPQTNKPQGVGVHKDSVELRGDHM